jgi:hypothetical protein
MFKIEDKKTTTTQAIIYLIIKELVKENPNDAILGSKVRELINKR